MSKKLIIFLVAVIGYLVIGYFVVAATRAIRHVTPNTSFAQLFAFTVQIGIKDPGVLIMLPFWPIYPVVFLNNVD